MYNKSNISNHDSMKSTLHIQKLMTFQVMPKHAGEYTCQPYNLRGSQGKSKPMIVEIRDPPTIVRRPEAEYQRNVGGKVTMPCQAAGPPKVTISWRRVNIIH